jgi:hypothetical protein
LLLELGSPIIPLTLVFESLGFKGVTGIEWGMLAGAVSVMATELGYRVEKIGRSIIFIRRFRVDETCREIVTPLSGLERGSDTS